MTETTIVQARAVWSPTTEVERKAFLSATVRNGEARLAVRGADALGRDTTTTLALDADSMDALATLVAAMNATMKRAEVRS